MYKLSVVGLGKLGACSAACFAYKGFETLGVDIDKRFVDWINEGKANVIEPRLQDLIDKSEGRLKATQDYSKAINETDVTFLIVPTPSRTDGHFSDMFLQDALGHLARALKESNKENHIFVITSTVSPTTTDEVLIPLIERESGRKINNGFEVCYNPEFIALGSVITDFLNPDMLLIGESSKSAGDVLERIYEKVCENKPYFARMSLVSAEITKISLNSYVTMKISYANTLANICEKIPGANVDDITKAIGADKRVSPYYLKGGIAFGGPCFPRDNRAFAAFADKYGYDAILAKATDTVNQLQIDHIVSKVLEQIPEDGNVNVGILGLAYKPNTPVIEESPAVKIINELIKRDIRVIAYDPLAQPHANALFGYKVLFVSNVKDCFVNSNIIVVTTLEKEFREIDDECISSPNTTVIDCWRVLDKLKNSDKIHYIGIGENGNN